MSAPKNQGINVGYYLSIISIRRWLIIIPFCLAIVVGCVLNVLVPKRYQASTVLLIQPPEVSEKLVQSVVTGAIEARINNVSQQILNTGYLEKVIQRLRLSADPNSPEVNLEDRIAGMRERITVGVSLGKGRKQKDAGTFEIAYQDKDPVVAMLIVNELASLFIDENIKMRESKAAGTSEFLETELESSRKRLEALEQELNEYRQKYMGELPEQLNTNLRVLDRLNTTLNEKEKSLQNARVNLMAIENEMAVRQNALSAGAATTDTPVGRMPEELMSPAQLREKLAGLRYSYTDEHPDVVRLKAKIEKIEAESGQNIAASVSAKKVDTGVRATVARQTTVISGTVRALEQEIANLNKEIREYQRRVEATPQRELEMLSMQRDYDNMKVSYKSLLNRKLEADVSVSLERKQKSEQFQIIEPASMPSMPVFPDPRKLFLITIAAGLGLGGGLVLLLEMSDTSVRKREDIEDKFELAILATVPRIFDDRDVSRHRIRTVATVASVLLALVLTAGFASLNFLGVETTLKLIGFHG